MGWSTAETGLLSMQHGRSVIYIAEIDGVPAASGALVFKNEDTDLANGTSHAMISNLIVDPRFQKHGLGTTLLRYLESQAIDRAYTSIAIGVDQSNVGARALYKRHGYIRLKDRTEAWGPVHYLAKPLEGEGS